jgi:hypothetical protein
MGRRSAAVDVLVALALGVEMQFRAVVRRRAAE